MAPRGASAVQEFLVRGYFLEGDGDANDEEEDEMPEPNTFWIEKADILETIDIEDIKAALRQRHEEVLGGWGGDMTQGGPSTRAQNGLE